MHSSLKKCASIALSVTYLRFSQFVDLNLRELFISKSALISFMLLDL